MVPNYNLQLRNGYQKKHVNLYGLPLKKAVDPPMERTLGPQLTSVHENQSLHSTKDQSHIAVLGILRQGNEAGREGR